MAGCTIKFQADTPDEIPLAMTITMPLAQWKRLRDQISNDGYPSWMLSNAIRDMVAKAEKHFTLESGTATGE